MQVKALIYCPEEIACVSLRLRPARLWAPRVWDWNGGALLVSLFQLVPPEKQAFILPGAEL